MIELVDQLAKSTRADNSSASREHFEFVRSASTTLCEKSGQAKRRDAARAQIALEVHGIVAGTWSCRCGAGYEYPRSSCRCGLEYPRRCATTGCAGLCEPREQVTAGGGVYVLVPFVCDACNGDVRRKARAAAYSESAIPPRERKAGAQLVPYPAQAAVLKRLEHWLTADDRVWRRRGESAGIHEATCAVFLGGQPGRGKSVLAAHVVYRAVVDLGLVDDFRWHSQTALAQLFAARFVGDDTARAKAMNRWQAVVTTPLLVIDDLFSSEPTPAFGVALGDLVRERLDAVLPTLITSNHPPVWSLLEADGVGRIQSRWRGYGLELSLGGVDLRRSA